jgi:hypothetical protein
MAEAGPHSKVQALNYRMRQVALMAPPSEHARLRQDMAAKEAALQQSLAAEKAESKRATDFQARVREQFEHVGNSKPLRASASLSALGAAVTSSNLRTMGHSASSTSFAPPKQVDEAGEDDEDDTTFLTAAPLSPRSLTAQARNPAPLGASATRVTLSGVPQSSSVPTNYFTCPKCRLNLQIHSVHSTMVVDILGEFGRMAQLMKDHRRQFNDEIEWAFRRKKAPANESARSARPKTKLPPAEVLEEYLDIKYYKEDAIPPTLAFVFPNMTYEAYLHYREDPSFLRSTIDLCEDCHLLVRVPLMAGSNDEVQSVTPLRLVDGAGSFFNPDTESLQRGQGHGSILSRQSHRALDQEVEERSFAAELAAQAQARRDRAPGEVDPHSAAAGLVPLDIRRLNQSTVELLAQIPYNDLEVAEFERKRALEADPGGQKSAEVARVLEKYKRASHAETHGHITASTPMTFARRAIQQQLLSAAGVAPHHVAQPTIQSMAARPVSAMSRAPNPFMPPRGASKLNQAQSTRSLRGAENSRRQAQTERHLDESIDADKPSQLMSRYDPDLVSSMGGVVVSPAADAALVQSTRRRAHTEELVSSIIASSSSVRTQPSPDSPPVRFQAKFSARSAAVTSFSPLYAQLTAPKRLARPVDHVALEMEAHAAARVDFRPFKHATPKKNDAAGSRTPAAAPSLKVHSTPSGLSMSSSRTALQDLPMPYAVLTPSPYSPQLITVAHNRGQIQPFSTVNAPTM